jgi:hypothetical protein
MHTVNVYHQSKLVKTLEFVTERQAVNYLVEKAAEESLEVNDNYTEAYSAGVKPETLLILNEA